MKSLTESITIQVPERMAFVNITSQVEAAVRSSTGAARSACS